MSLGAVLLMLIATGAMVSGKQSMSIHYYSIVVLSFVYHRKLHVNAFYKSTLYLILAQE